MLRLGCSDASHTRVSRDSVVLTFLGAQARIIWRLDSRSLRCFSARTLGLSDARTRTLRCSNAPTLRCSQCQILVRLGIRTLRRSDTRIFGCWDGRMLVRSDSDGQILVRSDVRMLVFSYSQTLRHSDARMLRFSYARMLRRLNARTL